MTEQSTKNDDMTAVTVVCVAIATLSDGKPGYDLRFVTESGTVDPQQHWYPAKAIKKALIYVGAMYSVPMNLERNTAQLSSAKYLGQWPNEAERTEWRTQERAFEIAARAKKELLADRKDNPMITALQPIRRAWEKTDTVGRLAIEVQVLAYLRGATKYIKMENQ